MNMSIYTEAYEDLANAIVSKATEDYLYYSRSYFKLKAKYEKALANPQVIEHKAGETASCYRKRKQRHSPTRYKNQMDNTVVWVRTVREFFTSDWIKTISDIDGEIILKKLDEELEKEGHRLWD